MKKIEEKTYPYKKVNVYNVYRPHSRPHAFVALLKARVNIMVATMVDMTEVMVDTVAPMVAKVEEKVIMSSVPVFFVSYPLVRDL